ncbi:MAG: T9SS type A sorting domain-containing protein [Ignavibacteriales bacterium]|nr:T9SS type A sorting domain-containing protein [Ignavibacteriales bacterium]
MDKKNLLLQGLAVALVIALVAGATFVYFGSSDISTQKPKSQLFIEKFGDSRDRTPENPSFSEGVMNIRLNQLDGVSEPVVAINPDNDAKMVVAANDFRIFGNSARLFFSNDAGNSWIPALVPLSGLSNFTEATDPAVAYDAQGNVYYAMIHYQTFGNGDGLFVNMSADNGATWKNKAVEVKRNSDATVFEDRPAITVDNSSGTFKNNVYVTWTSLENENGRILFSRSVNGGASFENYIELATGKVHTTDVKVDQNGAVYVAFLLNNNTIVVRKSVDGGLSFGAPVTAATFEHSGIAYNNTFLLKQNGTTGVKVRSFPTLALLNNHVYICYSAKNAGDLSDIFMVKSPDGGATFSAPVKINNDNTGSDQFMPRADVRDGKLYITWLDSRDDANNVTIAAYLGVSEDAGASFTNRRLASQDFNPSSILLKNYIGDYIGLAVGRENIISVWTDGRNNLFDVYAGIIKMNPTSVDNPAVAGEFTLNQNYPNPFNPSTVISYSVPAENQVTIKLYDISGKEIANLFNGFVGAGSHSFNFDAKGLRLDLASGTYVVKVQYGEIMKSIKMSFVK